MISYTFSSNFIKAHFVAMKPWILASKHVKGLEFIWNLQELTELLLTSDKAMYINITLCTGRCVQSTNTYFMDYNVIYSDSIIICFIATVRTEMDIS